MIEITIKSNGRKIEIGEPTIEAWKYMYSSRDITDENKFKSDLVKSSTKLTDEEIRNLKHTEVEIIADALFYYYENLENKFVDSFEFEGKTYRFIDLPTISFGQYVDIDNYLGKSDLERVEKLNYYMSMLYVGDGEDPNDIKQRKVRAELFNRLPIRYYIGADSFFLSLRKILQSDTKDYFLLIRGRMMRVIWKINRVLTNSGVGILRLLNWPVMTLQRLTKSRNNPLPLL